MKERENGYYWVLFSGHWTPAHWDGENYWQVIGLEDDLVDIELDDIDENQIHYTPIK